MAATGIVAFAFFLRCFHLLDTDHYYIVSPDSHFFHWLAARVMAGEGPPSPPGAYDIYSLHSGLAYPLAYVAKAVGSVFNLSASDALDYTCKFLPPFVSMVTMVVVYATAARIYNRRVGILSALAWGLMYRSVYEGGAAGYLDRDPVSMLLLTIGALLFYASATWRLYIANRDVGWLIGCLGVLVLEGLLYLEWNLLGPVLLLAILTTYTVSRYVAGYLEHRKAGDRARAALLSARTRVNWAGFVLIMAVNAMAAVAVPSQIGRAWSHLTGAVSGSGAAIGELAGLLDVGFVDLLLYQFFLVPIAIVLYLTLARKEGGNGFVASWFLIVLFASLFMRRHLIYATPAACILSGAGLALLCSAARRRLSRAGVLLLFVAITFLACVFAWSIGRALPTAIQQNWQNALEYMREASEDDAVVMSWWDHGYWILDVADRRPLVDNGYYGWDDRSMMADIRRAYVTDDPSEAAQIMDKYGADYLLFSEADVEEARARVIVSWPRAPNRVEGEPPVFSDDALVVRSIAGDFQSGGGLELWYASPRSGDAPDDEDPRIVILRRDETGKS